MPWIQLKLNTTGANAEDLSDALMEAGAVSITFQDTHDTPVFEPLPGETRLWGDTDVISTRCALVNDCGSAQAGVMCRTKTPST